MDITRRLRQIEKMIDDGLPFPQIIAKYSEFYVELDFAKIDLEPWAKRHGALRKRIFGYMDRNHGN